MTILKDEAVTVQWVGLLALSVIVPGSIPGSIDTPLSQKERSLSVELGVNPEFCQVCKIIIVPFKEKN